MGAEPVDTVTFPAGRRRPARATSEDLVEAAIRVIGREGVSATTTRKIAEEAGVPLGAVHYWYSDKGALLEEVVRTVVGRLESAVGLSGRPDGGTSYTDIRAGLQAAWDGVVGDDPGANLGLYELTTMALRTPSMRGLASNQYRSYREMAMRSLEPAIAHVEPARAAAVAEFVAVTFDGLGLAWLADPEGADPAAVLDLLAESVFAVIRGGHSRRGRRTAAQTVEPTDQP
jgi:AcrR family transcriptional regulator